MKTKINEIATILGLKNLTSHDETNSSYFKLQISELVNLTLYHDTCKSCLSVSIRPSKSAKFSYSDFCSGFDSFKFTDARSSESLAHDIKRRILVNKANEIKAYEGEVIDTMNRIQARKEKELNAEKPNQELLRIFKPYKDGSRLATWSVSKDGEFSMKSSDLTYMEIVEILTTVGF